MERLTLENHVASL